MERGIVLCGVVPYNTHMLVIAHLLESLFHLWQCLPKEFPSCEGLLVQN